MILIDIIALVVLLVSLTAIGLLIGRRFPTLASIDLQSAAGTLRERKSNLLEKRLRRKFNSMWERLEDHGGPVTNKIRQGWNVLHRRLVDLEHEYKVRALPVLLNRFQRRKVDAEIAEIMAQAEALLADGEVKAAEEKALHAIRLEPRSVPAFEFLGDLYLSGKEYGNAKEIYLYLLKLVDDEEAVYEHKIEQDVRRGQLPAAQVDRRQAIDLKKHRLLYYLDLAQAYRMLEDWPNAMSSIQEAAVLEPNNPKVLDEYLEVSIGSGQKKFAGEALETIRQTNSENSKISDWEERIEAIPAKASRLVPSDEMAEGSNTDIV